MLDALARVLRLDDGERAYMFELSGKDAARPRRRTAQKVQPQLRRLLADLPTTPAVVLGRRTDILAWNPMAAALFNDFARILDRSFLAGTDDPDQRLITLTAEPGTPATTGCASSLPGPRGPPATRRGIAEAQDLPPTRRQAYFVCLKHLGKLASDS